MALAFRFGQTVRSMRVVGRTIKLREEVSSGMQMVTYLMANGKKIKLTGSAFIHT